MKKSNLPQFTIITPSYNQAAFIRETIESVLSQQYPNLNYWVIDGKSTDGTVKILAEYKKYLQSISEKDAGQTAALNKGVLLSKPKPGFFAYLNSDDFYLPFALKKVAQTFADHPEKMWLVGDCKIVDTHSKEIQNNIRLYKKLWRSVLSFFVLTVLNPLPQPAIFIRTEALEKVGLFNQNLHYVMDYEYWLRLYKEFGAPLVLDTELAAFRIHGESKGTTSYKKQFAEGYQIASKFTKNWLALLLHRLHNQVIFLTYSQIK